MHKVSGSNQQLESSAGGVPPGKYMALPRGHICPVPVSRTWVGTNWLPQSSMSKMMYEANLLPFPSMQILWLKSATPRAPVWPRASQSTSRCGPAGHLRHRWFQRAGYLRKRRSFNPKAHSTGSQTALSPGLCQQQLFGLSFPNRHPSNTQRPPSLHNHHHHQLQHLRLLEPTSYVQTELLVLRDSAWFYHTKPHSSRILGNGTTTFPESQASA